MKVILRILTLIIPIIVSGTHVYAKQNDDYINKTLDSNIEYSSYEKIDSKTLYNKNTDSYYIFNNNDEMEKFLLSSVKNVSRSNYNMANSQCLPGNPGYPNCYKDYAVSSKTIILDSTTTGYLTSRNYLLGENGWLKGPGTMSYNISKSYSATFGYRYKSIDASITFGLSKGAGYSFKVPAGYKGNVKYEAKFKVVRKQIKVTYNSGRVQTLAPFLEMKMINGTGQYARVLKKI